MVEKYTPQELKVSDQALIKIKALLDNEDKENLSLRVFVTGGGCSGFQYEIKLENGPNNDDLILEKNGQLVLIDKVSLPFLENAVIDYTQELIGARFVIENPNATSSCGCGISFSI